MKVQVAAVVGYPAQPFPMVHGPRLDRRRLGAKMAYVAGSEEVVLIGTPSLTGVKKTMDPRGSTMDPS